MNKLIKGLIGGAIGTGGGIVHGWFMYARNHGNEPFSWAKFTPSVLRGIVGGFLIGLLYYQSEPLNIFLGGLAMDFTWENFPVLLKELYPFKNNK